MAKKKHSKKGMELPINTLVVVAIAVIVILAIAAFFMGGFGGSSKDVQNRQNFLNACSGWSQTGCGDNDMPSNLEDLYKIWQPIAAENYVTGQSQDVKVSYLKRQCGCYGTGTPTPTGKTCSDYTASECLSHATDCVLTKACSAGLGGSCVGTGDLGAGKACDTSSTGTKKQASVPYGCSGTTPVCCISKTTSEPGPPIACKSK